MAAAEPMIGRTLGHYLVLEQIGAGGMGVVFRAHDQRLERDVALKVLPPGMLHDDSARKRFREEALSLSRLNHPNIETVHDFDTEDGVDFLVMELIPGTGLDQRLLAGPLPEKEVLKLGQQLAEALAAAHSESIIHRDLKPGNLRVTPDGRLKVMDFGLARLFREVAETDITASVTASQGATGTLPYMAPEQLRGEKVDARSDVWAAGAVLYEMATGKRPFPGEHGPLLIDAILNREPKPPSAVTGKVSANLENILLKALDKDPNRRYQSANELRVDLERLSASAPLTMRTRLSALRRRRMLAVAALLILVAAIGVGANLGGVRDRLLGRPAAALKIESVAVLPLENLSGDAQQAYFADGMTEALINDLARTGALRVIARNSVMRYQGSKKPLSEIARELGVDAVVTGSIVRAGSRVRVTAQLTEARSEHSLWADRYERELHDVISIQDEFTRAIVREINANLSPQQQERLARVPAKVDPEVYDLYLKGRDAFNKREGEKDVQQALAYYEQAISKDPAYAPAHASLAEALTAGVGRGMITPRAEGYARARVAASRALELDDSLAEAHLALAGVKGEWDWDWEGGLREFKRALELNPNYANGHCWYSSHLSQMGRHAEAIAEARLGERLDPFSQVCGSTVADALFYARRYDECIAQARKLIQARPNAVGEYFVLRDCYAAKGMFDEAVAALVKVAPVAGTRKEDIAGYERAYKTGGWKGATAYDIEWRKREGYLLSPSHYIILGKYDKALEQLEKAVDEHRLGAITLKVDPFYDPVRSHPRFQALLRRMNFPP
ncbi:MAG TPA: protein kinase [Terriglobales bacterium]|nr:protein kinase [Terriglobales bacterium]